MDLTLEREFQLRSAEEAVADCSRSELMAALRYAWKGWLTERGHSENMISDALGAPLTISGPLLPESLRRSAYPQAS
jgi:hypothetical protein